MKKRIIAGALALCTLGGLTAACTSDADRVAGNISKEAEAFQVQRRIVFYNGITDKYMLVIEGRCSVETSESALGGSLEVTCKLGEDEYKKHFLGLSDNVTYFVEQLEGVDVSEYTYKVVFKPTSILPGGVLT